MTMAPKGREQVCCSVSSSQSRVESPWTRRNGSSAALKPNPRSKPSPPTRNPTRMRRSTRQSANCGGVAPGLPPPQCFPPRLFYSRDHVFSTPGDSGPRSRKARRAHRGPGNSAQQSTAIRSEVCDNAHWAGPPQGTGPMWRVFLLRGIRSIYSTLRVEVPGIEPGSAQIQSGLLRA